MQETREQSVQHLRIFNFVLSTGARLDGGTVVELIGKDEVFECFGVRMGREVVVKKRNVGAVVPLSGSVGMSE